MCIYNLNNEAPLKTNNRNKIQVCLSTPAQLSNDRKKQNSSLSQHNPDAFSA